MSETTEDLKKMVLSAEAAVASVKDPELRRAAFEKVLERLLTMPEPASPNATPGRRQPPPTPPAKTAARGPGKPGPTARVEELIAEGFFATPRSLGDVLKELGTRGFHTNRQPLSVVMLRLCRNKKLRRQNGTGDDEGYVYSNW
jgi:hypothetical protein